MSQNSALSTTRSASPIIAVLAFAGIAVSVQGTLVIPLLFKLPVLLHTSPANTSWVVTATLLAGAVATPVLGRLGDMYGKRRIIFISLGLLTAGSLVCAFSSSLTPMVIGRALQGSAMGVIPLGISVMRDTLPRERMGSAMALMSSSLGVGGALGLPASGLIAQQFDWHTLFFCAAAISAIATVLIAALVPESPVRTPGRFDIIGAAGLAAGLVSLLLALSKGSNWGWGSATTLGLFAAGLVVLLAWGAFELRTREPLVDLRTTARPEVLFTNLAAVVIGFAMYAMSLILPQLLQLPKATGYGLGLSMVAAGLCMAPGGLMMMFFSPVSARLSRARGPKTSLMVGAAIIAVGYALGLVLLHEVWQVIIVSGVIAIGIAIGFAAMPALIMAAVPLSETASANGLNTLMRSIGGSTAGAAIGVVLANTATRFGPVSLPSMTGFHTGFAIACGASIAAILIAAMIPGNRSRERAEQTQRSIDAVQPSRDSSFVPELLVLDTSAAHAHSNGAGSAATGRPIVVAIERSPTGVEVTAAAAELATLIGCPVEVLHVLETGVFDQAAIGGEGLTAARRTVKERLDQLVAAGIEATGHILGSVPDRGAAGRLVARYANQLHARAIVVGVPAHGSLAGFIDAGSNHELSKIAQCHVLLVTPGARPHDLGRASSQPPRQELAEAEGAAPVALRGISGTVRGRDGDAVGMGVVTVASPDGRQVARAPVYAGGTYALTGISPGVYTLIVSVAGHRPEAATVTVHPNSSATHHFVLAGTGSVHGIVRSDHDDAALAGAAVRATDPLGQVLATARTGSDGAYRLAEMPEGTATVAASAPGHEAAIRTVEVVPGRSETVNLTLVGIGEVYGAVHSPGGAALPGATVTATDAGGQVVASAVTGQDGTYRLSGLATGAYTLVASGHHPVVRKASVSPGELATVDVAVGAGER